jgi:hypothetical protein
MATSGGFLSSGDRMAIEDSDGPGWVAGVSDDGDVKMRGIDEVQSIGCLFAEVELELSTDYWPG